MYKFLMIEEVHLLIGEPMGEFLAMMPLLFSNTLKNNKLKNYYFLSSSALEMLCNTWG